MYVLIKNHFDTSPLDQIFRSFEIVKISDDEDELNNLKISLSESTSNQFLDELNGFKREAEQLEANLERECSLFPYPEKPESFDSIEESIAHSTEKKRVARENEKILRRFRIEKRKTQDRFEYLKDLIEHYEVPEIFEVLNLEDLIGERLCYYNERAFSALD